MLLLIKYTLLYGIVLMLVALGGMFSEHSGIINIALEGIMVIGGVAGVLTLTMLPANLSPFLTVLIPVLVAALAGVVYSLLLAFASINLKADQTIGGTALNMLATALAMVIAKGFNGSASAKLGRTAAPNSGSPWWDRIICCISRLFSSGVPSSRQTAATSWAPMTRWPKS